MDEASDRRPGTFKPGQSGNPRGRTPGSASSGRSPVLRAMQRVVNGRLPEKPSALERRCQKWCEDDFPAFVKEFTRLRTLEEGKGEQAAAQGESDYTRPLPPDAGTQKVRELIAELQATTHPSLIDRAVREEQEAIAGLVEAMRDPDPLDNVAVGLNAACDKIAKVVRSRIKPVPARVPGAGGTPGAAASA